MKADTEKLLFLGYLSV